MSMDKATVQKIAILARIEVVEADLEPLAQELSHILGWIEQLGQVDTDNVPPMSGSADLKLKWRANVVNDGVYSNKILANAPEVQDKFFTVPKVVE